MIKGITVTLHKKTQTGVDGFGHPTFSVEAVLVDNVLVAPMSDEEIVDTLNLTGRRAVYQLGIPKGDTNDWENVDVEFFGRRFHTIGMSTEGISNMIPLEWNKKVKVECIG